MDREVTFPSLATPIELKKRRERVKISQLKRKGTGIK